MKETFTYFVSYIFTKNRGTGHGRTTIDVNQRVGSANVNKWLKNIEDTLIGEHDYDDLRILNFQEIPK